MDKRTLTDVAGEVLSLRASAEAIVCERGGVADPRSPVLERLLDALDLTLEDLATLDGDAATVESAARLRHWSRCRRIVDGDPSALLLAAAAFDHLGGAT